MEWISSEAVSEGILIEIHIDLVDGIELGGRVDSSKVFLKPPVTRFKYVSCNHYVAMYRKGFLWFICVDTNSSVIVP